MIDPRYEPHLHRYPELERLICAAVSNHGIAAELLAAPERALDRIGVSCRLSAAERDIVTSIADARDIYDFAAQLYAKVRQSPPTTLQLPPLAPR